MVKTIQLLLTVSVLSLAGCSGSPYYSGGTGYRVNDIGGLPVSAGVGVYVSPAGITFSPTIYGGPRYTFKR